MRRDAQVRACLTTKRLAVLSEAAHVFPADASPRATVAARTVEEALAALPGGVGGLVSGALEALTHGFALGEYIWNPVGGLEAIKWHDPRRFTFYADPLGNIIEAEVTDANLRLPLRHFVHYAYQSRYGNPYGESDLVAAYRAWTQKDLTQRMWLHALDRFGAPVPVARVPKNWGQDELDNLVNLLARLQNEASLVVTDEVQLDAPFGTGRVEPARAFHTACQWYDTQIARAILGQELTTQGNSGGTGSYALARVHEGVQEDWIQSLRGEIAETVLTGQVARTLTAALLGDDYPVPTVAFPNLNDSQMDRRRLLINEMLRGGVIGADESWIREFLGVPVGATRSAIPTTK